MVSIEEWQRHKVPWISYDIPHDERSAVYEVSSWLSMLDDTVCNFWAALELFDYAEGHRKSGFPSLPTNTPPDPAIQLHRIRMRWQFMAARDAAMTIFHFKKTMEKIRGSVGAIPSLLEQLDIEKLKIASKLLDSYFPNSKKMRNLVAHLAETTINPLDPQKTDDSDPNILVLHSLAGRRYTSDYRGETFSYELSHESLTKLNRVKLKIFEGFNLVNVNIRKSD